MSINEAQDEVIAEFSDFDDWMDRYQLLIDLGNEQETLDEKYKTEQNLIEGCQSRVWLQADEEDGKIIFKAESDALIVKGIISLLMKVLSGHTDSAKAQAASLGGTVLNVARIDASVYFDTATVNFYMPGVTAGQNIQVYQYDYTNGQWTGVAVAEVREDHVVVDMTSLGVLAFFEVPAAE